MAKGHGNAAGLASARFLKSESLRTLVWKKEENEKEGIKLQIPS